MSETALMLRFSVLASINAATIVPHLVISIVVLDVRLIDPLKDLG